MPTSTRSLSVPKPMQAKYDELVALTDAFCDAKLDAEYGELARAMAAALCRKRPSPVASGQARAWACAIVYTLGRVNFVSDRSKQPYLPASEIWKGFGVGESTTYAKAKIVADAVDAHRMNAKWMRAELAARNPMVWLAQVNGILVDLRDMPREVREIAFAKGMIPFVPEDRA